MKNEKTVNVMSESATARFCGVSVVTVRKYRTEGKIEALDCIPGVVTFYDADAVKAYFDSDRRYQVFKARRTGAKIMITCKPALM